MILVKYKADIVQIRFHKLKYVQSIHRNENHQIEKNNYFPPPKHCAFFKKSDSIAPQKNIAFESKITERTKCFQCK